MGALWGLCQSFMAQIGFEDGESRHNVWTTVLFASLCECHMLASLAQSVRARQQRLIKTGQEASKERWQTWQKGKIWHAVCFQWWTGSCTKKHTHAEEPLLLFETPPIRHMTPLLLTAGIYSLESFLTADSYSNCFFISQPVLPASHLKLF